MTRHVKCNLCSSDNTKLLYRIDRVNIVKCKKCGLVYNNPQKEEKDLKKIYSEEYFKTKDYDNFGYGDYIANEKNLIRTFKKRLRFIHRFVRTGNLLDVGCATGFFLSVARENGWKTTGVEISPYASNYAKERFGLSVINDTLKKTNFQSESFDIITMWGFVQELSSPYEEFAEARRILKKGGHLFIQTSDISSLHARLSKSRWIEFKPKTTTTYFSIKTVKKMLEKAGFKVTRITRRGTGQYANLKLILERLSTYHLILAKMFKTLGRLVNTLDTSLYINPMDSMLICARKDES